MKNLFHTFTEACELALEVPLPNEIVRVIGRDYKAIGYIDEQGTWHLHRSGRILEDVIDWSPLK